MNLKWVSLLRALGVVLVVVYHFFPALLPGGFIGVDIFFVFSGYLICSLLVQEFENTEKLNLLRFYHKRIRRLLPAALFMVLITLSLLLLITPDFRANIIKQTAAVLGWCTNYYEISTGASYENALLPHVFVHTWTLAVEMHFYLIWGAVALAGVGFVRLVMGKLRSQNSSLHTQRQAYRSGDETRLSRREEARRRKAHSVKVLWFKLFLALVLLILIVASYLHMRALALPADDPSVAYFATTSHIFPLFIGAAAALLAGFSETVITRLLERIPFVARIVLSAIPLLAVVYFSFVLTYSSKATYTYGVLVVALLVAVFLIIARSMQSQMSTEPKPISYIADRSYSIYLFHWPLYIIIEQLLTANGLVGHGTIIGEGVIGVLAIIATIIFSDVSFRFVEKPLRVHSKRNDPAPAAQDAVDEPQNASLRGRLDPSVATVMPARVAHVSYTRTRNPKQRVTPSRQKRHIPAVAQIAVAAVVVLGLGSLSANALTTAPRTSSIQQAYEHEALFQSIERLDETGVLLSGYAIQPVANVDDVGTIYATGDTNLEAEHAAAEEQRNNATKSPAFGSVEAKYGSVTVIGDSVVMGAMSGLQEALGGGYIDAEGSRRTEQVYPLLDQLRNNGLLGDYVVIGLSTNVFNPESLDGARYIAENIGPGHRLIFITGYGHDGVYALNDTLWSLAAEYPYVTIADWYGIAAANPEMLPGDHIHIGGNDEAIALYSACVVDAIERASQKPTS